MICWQQCLLFYLNTLSKKQCPGKANMYSSLRKILFYLIVAMAIGMIILAFVRNVPVAKIAIIDDSEFDTMGIEFSSF